MSHNGMQTCLFACYHFFNIIFFINKTNNKFMKKKFYEKPSVEVVVLNQQQQLLAGSNPAPNQASFDDYKDGEFSW